MIYFDNVLYSKGRIMKLSNVVKYVGVLLIGMGLWSVLYHFVGAQVCIGLWSIGAITVILYQAYQLKKPSLPSTPVSPQEYNLEHEDFDERHLRFAHDACHDGVVETDKTSKDFEEYQRKYWTSFRTK